MSISAGPTSCVIPEVFCGRACSTAHSAGLLLAGDGRRFVTRFRIRELDEETLVELDRLEARAREASLVAGLSEEESLRILPLGGRGSWEEGRPRPVRNAAVNSTRRFGGSGTGPATTEAPVETRQQIVDLQRQRRDLIIVRV